MFAIVEIAGQQFKVEKDQKLYVHRLEAKEGDNISFNNVLLTDDGKKVNIGTPNVLGAEITAKVLAHMKGDKVKVFKKKRRKGYQKLNGHRQYFSHIQIDEISLDGKKTSEKKETEPKKTVAKKEETKKVEPKKPTDRKEETEKVETKKPVEKKTETKKPSAKKEDNLTKIEGIGPKIAGILKDAGFDTFKKLSEAKAEKISEILVEAGGNAYNRFDTTTWPEQAKLAADGKWDELKELQDKLSGGKE